MIIQKEIREKSIAWGVHPDTVDKDYVLGHFLVAFHQQFGDKLIFKGGTCLRKCYFPDYRFSEDLDFTSVGAFQLEPDDLTAVCKSIELHTGIVFIPEEIVVLRHQNEKKGYQVKIKYWGANHLRNQQPLPPDRWLTKIKLEISTDELCLLPPACQQVHHPYSDTLISSETIPCYVIDEIIAEKLRSLVQRSYTAPRDFYDIFHLTHDFTSKDWQVVKPVFIEKMNHKGFQYTGPHQLINETSLKTVRKAWHSSIAHQINIHAADSPDVIITEVIRKIQENL